MLFTVIVGSAPALGYTGTYTPIYDTGDTADTADTGDSGGSVVVQAPENNYDGHLDGKLAYQVAGDEGGCATGGGSADLVLALVLVGVAAARLRRPRR